MVHHDKRANPRIPVHDGVTLVVLGTVDKELCILEDIDKGGVKFFSTRELVVGNRVELRIPSPEDEPDIVIQAKVMRVGSGSYNKPYSYGCVIEQIENA